MEFQIMRRLYGKEYAGCCSGEGANNDHANLPAFDRRLREYLKSTRPSGMLIEYQNFFSTQFASQKQHDSGSSQLVVTSNAWVFATIALPLTIVMVAT